jgi:hypothetical protein
MTSKLPSHFLILILASFAFSSCSKEELIEKKNHPTTYDYLHLSHTRTNSNPLMDSIAEQIDFSKFKMLWLGGDLANLTSLDNATMDHADSIYNLSHPNTLWALGNHDYSDLNRVQVYTNRAPYFTYHKNGITFLILDTQDSLSNIIGAQKILVNSVLDTISESSHLIILHHKLIWMYDNPSLEPIIPSVANGWLGNCFYCINPNNFYPEIYPKLITVKQRGIEVLCIGGDIGFQASEFEHITPEGIHFMASGISAGSDSNKALIFHHSPSLKTLTWNYKLIEELL